MHTSVLLQVPRADVRKRAPLRESWFRHKLTDPWHLLYAARSARVMPPIADRVLHRATALIWTGPPDIDTPYSVLAAERHKDLSKGPLRRKPSPCLKVVVLRVRRELVSPPKFPDISANTGNFH